MDKHDQWLFKLDSFIYYEAVYQWFDGGDLYSWYANPDQHLWSLTCMPLAAWVISLLTWMSYQQVAVLLVVVTPLYAAVTAYAVLRRLAAVPRMVHSLAPQLTLIGIAALEPFPRTMEYAQVNAILMALMAVDLFLVPERSRWRGTLSDLATATRLTPTVVILVLLARRGWRATTTMTGSAIGPTPLAALAAPVESWESFTSAMWDPGRVGSIDYSGNQNLKGTIARRLPEAVWNSIQTAYSLLAVMAAQSLCRRLDRLRGAGGTAGGIGQDDDLVLSLQISAVMVLDLPISPIP